MSPEVARLIAFFQLPDAVGIVLSALPLAVRIYEQVPQSERSPSTLIDLLEKILSPEGKSEGSLRESLVEHRLQIAAMVKVLRLAEATPNVSLLDPTEGPPH